jgi:threonine dehydratase
MTLPISLQDVEQAWDRIRPHIFYSPCAHSALLSEQLGSEIYLKLDNMQSTGSFKERGAANKLALLTEEERARGVIAASAGNHAQAVAMHGARLGISTKIVMPEGTPLVKVQRTKSFGGEIVLHGANYDAAYAYAKELQTQENRVFVHPFDDAAIMAGQGTVGLEILEQVPDIDAILVAVGGGGLIGGILAAVKTLRPDIQIIGVEPEVLPSMKTALQNSGVIEIPAAQTLADGIAVRRVGRIPFEQIQHQIDDMVTVTEAEIARAVLVLLEQEKTLAEGAGAASLAALLAGKVHLPGKRVCALICGGNIDVNVISRIIERGLVATGRLCRLSLRVTDTPGALAHVLTIVGRLKANVLEIHHNRTFTSGEQFGTTHVELKLETRGDDHVEAIRRALNDDEFTIIEHL